MKFGLLKSIYIAKNSTGVLFGENCMAVGIGIFVITTI